MMDSDRKLIIPWMLNSYFLKQFKQIQKIKLCNGSGSWTWSQSGMSVAHITGQWRKGILQFGRDVLTSVQKTASKNIFILVFLDIFPPVTHPHSSRAFQVGPAETLLKVKGSSRASILSFPAETKDALINGFYEDLAFTGNKTK